MAVPPFFLSASYKQMPVPVPKVFTYPARQVVKPPPRPLADHNASQHVINPTPHHHSFAPSEGTVPNWEEDKYYPFGDFSEVDCHSSAERPFVSQDLTAAGERGSSGGRVLPVHGSVREESANFSIMTWLKGVDARSTTTMGYETDDDVPAMKRPIIPMPLDDWGLHGKDAKFLDFHQSHESLTQIPSLGSPSFSYSQHAVEGGAMGPVTPFATYVDNITASEATLVSQHFVFEEAQVQAIQPMPSPQLQKPPPREKLTDPVYIKAYQDIAGPLSDWIADYVWKVCTTGLSLPARFVGMRFVNQSNVTPSRGLPKFRNGRAFGEKPPLKLGESIRHLLCATLLQPSGIALALWYISRLPTYLELQAAGGLIPSEVDFRNELVGDGLNIGGSFSDLAERAPFKVLLIGCMFANKWLDDHTFSNKTWCVTLLSLVCFDIEY